MTAIGLSGQMHGLVLVDAEGRPVRSCLTWADRRASAEVGVLRRRLGRALLVTRLGNAVNTSFTAAKVLWLRRHDPKTLDHARTMLLPKDYLRLRLTGERATDPSDASATLLFDLRRREWSPAACAAAQIDPATLPPVWPSAQIAGRLGAAAAAALGLRPGIPVATGAGDQEAGMVGQGILGPGTALVALGTGGQISLPLARFQVDPRLRVHTLCHAVPARWHLMGAILSAGQAAGWAARLLTSREGGIKRLTRMAANAPPGSGGLLFLPYLAGERTPHMDPEARGAYVGLGLHHGSADLARAVLEGVAFALRETLEIFDELGLRPRRLSLAGGGAADPLWRQVVSDVFGRSLEVTATVDASAVGAALLGGVAAGRFRSLAEVGRLVGGRIGLVQPDPRNAARYQESFAVYRGLYRSLRRSFHILAESEAGPESR